MGLQIFKNETAIKTSFPNNVLHELGEPSCPCVSLALKCISKVKTKININWFTEKT